MKSRFFSLFVALFIAVFACGQNVYAAANVWPSGPSKVSVGQTFQVVIQVSGAVDVDTVRMNGSFTADLLEWKTSSPGGVFQNVSPGTYVDQAKGIFSFGAFTLSSKANGATRFAVLTFKAKKAGSAYVQLTSNSKVLSAGEEQIGSVGRLNITIEDKVAAPEQPLKIPEKVPDGEAVISLFSTSHPDPNVWFPSGDVLVGWKIEGKPVKKTYIGFDQAPEGPAEIVQNDSLEKFSTSTDGTWYVHLGVDFTDRTYKRVDLRVLIDTKPPHRLTPTVDQTEVGSNIPNYVRFGTTDDESGIAKYDVLIDGKFVTSTKLQSYPVNGLAAGSHTVLVRASDFAKNTVEGSTTFRILPDVASAPLPIVGSDIFMMLLALLILIIILITLWILIGRRRKKKNVKLRR